MIAIFLNNLSRSYSKRSKLCTAVHFSSYILFFRRVEAQRRKERNEAPLYMSVEIFQEADLQRHHGVDLIDFEEIRGV